jgi:hypothetical protein
LIYLCKDGPTKGIEPESWKLCFNPLSQLTGVEESERRLNNAKTDREYVDMGAVTPAEIATSRFQDGRYGDNIELDSAVKRPQEAVVAKPTAPVGNN